MKLLEFPFDPHSPFPAALVAAAEVARQLTDAGIEIHSAFDNGRRMVLLIDKPPAFAAGHIKRHHPNGMGGTTTVFAAGYHGCQLEWTTDTYAAEVGRG